MLAAFVVGLLAAWQQTSSIAPSNDSSALVSTARLEERVQALYRLLDERARQVELALASAEKATDKAQEAQSRVNATQNEFRGALTDQNKLFASRESMDRILDRVSALEAGAAGGLGRAGGASSAQDLLLSVLPILIAGIALVAAFFTRRHAFTRRTR